MHMPYLYDPVQNLYNCDVVAAVMSAMCLLLQLLQLVYFKELLPCLLLFWGALQLSRGEREEVEDK